jgi:ribonuclease D
MPDDPPPGTPPPDPQDSQQNPPAQTPAIHPAMKKYRPGRADHRARHHDSAHSDSSAPPPPAAPPPVHPLIPRGDAEIIRTQDELTRLVGELRASGRFAYDSEFIGELTYIPKLCLIQVATTQKVSLIDPLEPLDLMPFWGLLCDASVEKIVHAGAQDLEPVFRHRGCPPANVFDTQIAGGFIAMSYPVSLTKLVREMTGTSLGKGLTFTHWDQRPLSGMQLRYAADDVRYLLAVREELARRLDALGHAAWAAAECESLCDPEQYRFDPEHTYRRIRGATSLTPTGLAILRELVIWRDACARLHDLPPRAFLKDEILVDMARTPPRTVDKLARVKGLPRPVELSHGKEIVEAIGRATAIPHAELPSTKHREETPVEKFRADALWAAVECLSLGRGIDPNLIASRQEISQLYRHLRDAKESADEVRLLKGWRRQAVGDTLLAMVNDGGSATLRWQGGTLRATSD